MRTPSLLFVLALGTLGCASGDQDIARRGLLPTRVLNPIHTMFSDLTPDGATVLSPGKTEVAFDVTYTSFFREDADAPYRILLDGELLRGELRARHGLSSNVELGIIIPSMYTSSGFLDGFIIDYHDFFGFSQGGRDDSPEDQFDMGLTKNGEDVYRLEEDRLALGDVGVEVQVRLRDEDDSFPAMSARALVETPTGDEDRGFGNGEWDLGVGLAAQKGYGRGTLYANANVMYNGEPESFEDADIGFRSWTYTLMTAFEYQLVEGFSAVGQMSYGPSPVEDTGLLDADDDALILTLGGVVDLSSDVRLRIGFVEDLFGETTQDFSALAGVVWTF